MDAGEVPSKARRATEGEGGNALLGLAHAARSARPAITCAFYAEAAGMAEIGPKLAFERRSQKRQKLPFVRQSTRYIFSP